MLLHVADSVRFRRFAINQISVEGEEPGSVYEQAMVRAERNRAFGIDVEYGPAL